jgi:hypothetical protein
MGTIYSIISRSAKLKQRLGKPSERIPVSEILEMQGMNDLEIVSEHFEPMDDEYEFVEFAKHKKPIEAPQPPTALHEVAMRLLLLPRLDAHSGDDGDGHLYDYEVNSKTGDYVRWEDVQKIVDDLLASN